MPRTAENTNWAASVDSIVSRAPRSASHRDPLRAQVRLLALLSSAAPLNVLLGALASYVETWTEGLHCTVLLVDPTGRLLRPGAAPSLPDAYTRAIDPVPIGIGEGSCGTAAARREMVVVEDVERSDLWTKYAPIALSYGLRACWSVPIVDDAGALLGTLALYYRERRAPSTRETDLIQFASSLAAFVMQRHRDDFAPPMRGSKRLFGVRTSAFGQAASTATTAGSTNGASVSTSTRVTDLIRTDVGARGFILRMSSATPERATTPRGVSSSTMSLTIGS